MGAVSASAHTLFRVVRASTHNFCQIFLLCPFKKKNECQKKYLYLKKNDCKHPCSQIPIGDPVGYKLFQEYEAMKSISAGVVEPVKNWMRKLL